MRYCKRKEAAHDLEYVAASRCEGFFRAAKFAPLLADSGCEQFDRRQCLFVR